MSEKKKEDLLDKGDVAEATASAAHLISGGINTLEDWEHARLARKPPPVPAPPASKPPTRVQRLDRALGRGAKTVTRGIAKGLSPVEKVLAVAEIGNLVASKAARQEAIDTVEQMGRDPNVNQLEQFTQGFPDPFATAYGLQHWGRELGKAQNRARQSGRRVARGKRMLERGETPETGGITPDPETRERFLRRRAALIQARKENRE